MTRVDTVERPILTPLTSVSDVSVVVTMICRNEDVNFKSNLALWLNIADYFVFIMDARNDDNSEISIKTILTSGGLSGIGPKAKGYHIFKSEFVGFGQARTLSLQKAWEAFPQASHVLIADPDWRPSLETMDKSQLLQTSEVYRFTIYDRNGHTTRQMDWLLRHRQGLEMRYHLHEVLNIGYYSWVNINWQIREIEQAGTWHNAVGHTDSFSSKRYLFDLSLLEKDKTMFPQDPHVDYYLGITHNAYAHKKNEADTAAAAAAAAAVADTATNTNIRGKKRRPELAEDVSYHYRQALKYLHLRATSYYEHEFIEQRWAAMLNLGVIFDDPALGSLYDPVKGNAWYNLCRDFNKNTYECSAYLVKHYMRTGLLNEALIESNNLVRTKFASRAMLNTVTDLDCVMPTVVNSAFAANLQSYHATVMQQQQHVGSVANNADASGAIGTVSTSSSSAKYAALLSHWVAGNPVCTSQQRSAAELNDDTIAAMEYLLVRDKACLSGSSLGCPPFPTSESKRRSYSVALKSVTIADLCADKDLQAFLIAGKIHVHPCSSYIDDKVLAASAQVGSGIAKCSAYSTPYPGLDEEHHMQLFRGQYIGAASITDILHYVHLGNGIRVMLSGPSMIYRVLFAEHFDENMVLNLLGFAASRMNSQIEVTVVSSNTTKIDNLKDLLTQCAAGSKMPISVYHFDSLVLWATQYRENSIEAPAKKLPLKALPFFDYIEYNGGLHFSKNASSELSALHKILGSDGVLGVTYFTSNIHVDSLQALLESQHANRHVFPPSSYDQASLIAAYFDFHRLGNLFGNDRDLYKFLTRGILNGGDAKHGAGSGADSGTGTGTGADKQPSYAGYSVSEVTSLLQTHDFNASILLPASLSQPYEEIQHYNLKKFWALGVAQERMLHTLMPSFRKVIYATKMKSTLTDKLVSIPGRAQVAKLLDLVGENFIIVDRHGHLGRSFSAGEGNLMTRRSLQFSANVVYSLPRHYNVSYTIPPSILPCVNMLSSSPTFAALLSTNVAFWVNAAENNRRANPELNVHGRQENGSSASAAEAVEILLSDPTVYSYSAIKQDLILFLDFLERTNFVSFLHNLISESSTEMAALPLSRQAVNGALGQYPDQPTSVPAKSALGSTSTAASAAVQTQTLASSPLHSTSTSAELRELRERVQTLTSMLSELQMENSKQQQQQQKQRSGDVSGGGMECEVGQECAARQEAGAAAEAKASSSGMSKGAKPETPSQRLLRKQAERAAAAAAAASGDISGVDRSATAATASSGVAAGLSSSSNPALARKLFMMNTTRIPSRKDRNALYASFRRPECSVDMSTWMNPTCLDPVNAAQGGSTLSLGPYRISASVHLACLKKIQYDVWQFQYISKKKPQVAAQIHSNVIPTMNKIIQFLQSRRGEVPIALKDSEDFCDSLHQNEMSIIFGYLNRVFLYSREPKPSWGASIVNSVAASHFPTALKALLSSAGSEDRAVMQANADVAESAFVVIDGVLKKAALQAISNILLMSCIWFDSTNGQAYASHHDDGLAHDVFFNLAQEMAELASTPEAGAYTPIKYFALNMDLRKGARSPIMMPELGQVYAVLWVSPISTALAKAANAMPDAPDDYEESSTDGIVTYSQQIYNAINADGGVNAKVHPDFISLGDQFAGTDKDIHDTNFGSVIRRKPNRMVLIKHHIPFLFNSDGAGAGLGEGANKGNAAGAAAGEAEFADTDLRSTDAAAAAFERFVMHAIVVVLQIKGL